MRPGPVRRGSAVNLDRKHGATHNRSVVVDLRDPGAALLESSQREASRNDADLLFKEARRRRRKRMLVVAMTLSVALSFAVTVFAAGGGGSLFGGSSSPFGGTGPSRHQATHQQSPTAHGTKAKVSAICGKSSVHPSSDSNVSKSLLPCFKVEAIQSASAPIQSNPSVSPHRP